MEDNFLTELVAEPTRADALLDLLFVKTDGFVSDMMAGAFLGCRNHEIRVFNSQRGASRTSFDFW